MKRCFSKSCAYVMRMVESSGSSSLGCLQTGRVSNAGLMPPKRSQDLPAGGCSETTRSIMSITFFVDSFFFGWPGRLLIKRPEADSHCRGPWTTDSERGVEAVLGLPLPFGLKVIAFGFGRKSKLAGFICREDAALVRLDAVSDGPVGGWRLSCGTPG